MRTFFLLLCTSVLTACTGLPLADIQSVLNTPYVAADDNLTANWVLYSKSSFQLRLARLDEYPRTEQTLAQACQRGIFTELIIPLNQLRAAMPLRNSCVRIWVTGNPDMARSATVALMDQDTLIADGHYIAVGDQRMRKEYGIQQYLKHGSELLR
jgi:hypothetical protein